MKRFKPLLMVLPLLGLLFAFSIPEAEGHAVKTTCYWRHGKRYCHSYSYKHKHRYRHCWRDRHGYSHCRYYYR